MSNSLKYGLNLVLSPQGNDLDQNWSVKEFFWFGLGLGENDKFWPENPDFTHWPDHGPRFRPKTTVNQSKNH